MIAPESFLCQGPWWNRTEARERLVERMATEIEAGQAFRDRGDAIQVLRRAGHPTLDIFVLVDDAIYACKQEAIAREFSAP